MARLMTDGLVYDAVHLTLFTHLLEKPESTDSCDCGRLSLGGLDV